MSQGIPSDWRIAYASWLKAALPALEARDWKTAFAGRYPYLELEDPPLQRLAKPLTACRVALVTSGGLCQPDQRPFDHANILGDASFRVIAGSGPLPAWQIFHDHYDHTAARQDYNVVFPLDRLRELAAQGDGPSLAPRHFSFMGYQPNPEPFVRESVPAMKEMMVEDGVDVALLVPV